MSFLESLRKIFKNNSQIISFSAKEGDNLNTLSTEGKYRNSTSKFVTFSDIEIIDVESYKEYNKLDEIYLEDNEKSCSEKCGGNCKCILF